RDARALDPSAPIQHYYDTIRSGNILIENDIAGESVELSLEDGEVKYTFLSGAPSLLVDRQNPELSFTKAVQIIGPNSTWGDTEGIYRGIVLGDVLDNTQNSFYTISDVADYQVINMILRDPPGSKSYSEFERNLKLTKIRSSTFKSGLQQGGTLMAGSLFAINMGNSFIESTVVKYQHLYGGKWNTSQHRETSERSKLTFEEGVKIATSSENKNTGAGSDIFVGNALNLFFSPSYNLSIIELSRCGGEFECIGETFSVGSKTYAFARAKSISVGMGEHTTFYYTQKQLENLIKDLERDVVFEVDPTKKSQMETQIRIWKSAIAQNEYEKLMAKKVIEGGVTAEEAEEGWQFENITFAYGSSVEKSYQNTVVNDIEYSQQFSHYTGFRTELETFFGSVYVKLNFDIGYATYAELEDKVEVGETQKTKIHFQDNDPGDSYSVNMVLSGAQDTNDLYQELDDLYERSNNPGASLPAGLGISEVDGDFKYNNVQYINPIFITRGGRTSCPHEPEERAKYLEYLAPDFIANLMEAGYITDSLLYPGEKYRYQLSGYDPEKPDDEFILNYGTFQRDQPGIRIEPRVQRDIPLIAGNRATFDIILENLNLEDTIRSYTLMVDQRTTGAGPTMRLDGERFIKGTPIPLYKGEQLRKKITLRPIEGVYDYEDIVIYLVAGCQFDFGQDLDFQEDIFARDTISAFFKPSCPVASV
ncbi:MAG: hypothetical protein AAF551_13580, partial [Bacteroidota bacterium]